MSTSAGSSQPPPNPPTSVTPDQAGQEFKHALRRNLREARQKLSAATRACMETQINGHILRWMRGREAHHVAAYWPVRGEVDIRPAVRQLDASGREIYLPRVDEEQRGLMRFVPWDPADTSTQINRYGIPEPLDHNARLAGELDVILAPLLAFCPHGGRLGAGAGYYDRACADLNRSKTWFIGVAYGFQSVEGLPQEPWDIPLDGVFTEHGLVACNNRLQATLTPPANDQEHNEWPIG